MLEKLLKYEIRATARTFLPLYGLILLLAVVNRALFQSAANQMNLFNIPRAITMTVYVVLIVAMFVMTLVVTIQRFYKNLLGDEGYLSFTLPVKTHSQIDAKMIVTLLWSVLSILVAAASIFIIASDADTLASFSRFCAGVAELYSRYGLHAHLIAFEVVALCVVDFASGVLHIYASIAVGNLAGRHKQLAAFGAFIGFSVVEQIFVLIFVEAFGGSISGYFRAFHYSSEYFPTAPVEIALLGMIAYSAVFFAAFYFITDWILSRKLNLE